MQVSAAWLAEWSTGSSTLPDPAIDATFARGGIRFPSLLPLFLFSSFLFSFAVSILHLFLVPVTVNCHWESSI
ncbi:hypothetical protein ASPZODRAFT_1115264 [Penicilliopsis zonata CBS 506.65]|uniref:Uncharacterized protein n=1 Tax=Penicilliopsis zonata CBS 506.65 TaxID=1073090 RepID=A0A1L9SSR5_9EURO|nr:hypothetical protein ASPZODRAFT_1115264 [Penicilliopsis zonata CBS 506.65]OJJ50144.1 hypothetical protein ASPZODRAFT_1115264 [Penicilliopsis zonata CBS 506.65]